MMKKSLVTIAVFLITTAIAVAQLSSKEPLSFDQFNKDGIKKIDGDYPVYLKHDKYYLEIPVSGLSRDVLVMGYVRKGYSSAIAKSAGIIRFSKGLNNHLDATRVRFSEAASGDVNGDMEAVIKKSNLAPVNYSYRIEALGKNRDSYIIDITRQITDNGDWFSFPDMPSLSRPDPERSLVRSVQPADNAVRFLVERSQTDFNKEFVSGRNMDNASTYELELLFQQLPQERMPRKLAEETTAFETFSYMDYGKVAYTARKVTFVRKWDIRPSGTGKRRKDSLVTPERMISVAIDPNTPDFFRRYIEEGILAWNEAFHAAGYTDVLRIVHAGDALRLKPGSILVNWGNAFMKTTVATVEHPETGEIITARINITEGVAEELMTKYLVQCGAVDNRITENIKNPEVQAAILRWQMTKAMGEALGLRPDLSGSMAYSPAQLRNVSWLKSNSFATSIMDDLEFNYLVQPGDSIPVEYLQPHIGVADVASIKWAYGRTPAPRPFIEENKQDPITQHFDLSSNKIEASSLGIRNIERVFGRLDTISKQLDGTEDLYSSNGSLYGAAIKAYEKYVMDVLPLIGGVSRRTESTGETVAFTDAETQRKVLEFLSRYVFSGVPAWMKVNGAPRGRVIDIEDAFVHMQVKVLKELTDLQRLSALVRQETAVGKTAFTVKELFAFVDREVFQSFRSDLVLTSAQRTMQANFIYELSQSAFKANISGGLNDANILLHYYLTSTVTKLEQLGNTHADILTRENYRLMKMKADREFFNKIKA
ncbi:DUF5117 and DUF5118 domain-containing protein [Chitinophaga tropicalis]|uniref:DUF5117 domain-containing protein n=1 Tax=Chitinophaga tropicalis TaxID=2683588 RepID=A0A7K1U7L2_9BACT|nr:zinc-dependent metalloprotease [Chitinophaga tropicalis]MVT10344.1 DUF5117 domain-containing protein [Chitinophaga tropicalis]